MDDPKMLMYDRHTAEKTLINNVLMWKTVKKIMKHQQKWKPAMHSHDCLGH